MRNKRDVWTVNPQAFGGEFCLGCRRFFQGESLNGLKRDKIIADDGRETWRRYCECGEYDQWMSHFATFPADLIEPMVKAGTYKGGCVLDPFSGAGTTGMVCDRLHRDAILIEVNPDYAEMARQRLSQDAGPMFGDIQIITPAREAAE